MKLKIILFGLLLNCIQFSFSQQRKEIAIPDIPGYLVLKCDLHIHSVFSDGSVWPTIRIAEAWMEGLDAISLTEHIRWHKFKEDIATCSDVNRSYDSALEFANEKGILLIKGGEITREMPPGHFNALFLEDVNKLNVDAPIEALREAKKQGAFVHWNHPGNKWHDIHTTFFEEGLFQGIEVCNGNRFYEEAFKWANNKGLTLFSNSDIHHLISTTYDLNNSHRPLTLVLAKERTVEAMRDACFKGNTVAYFENTLVGKEKFLNGIFNASIEYLRPRNIEYQNTIDIRIYNKSDIDYKLEKNEENNGLNFPEKVVIKAHSITIVSVVIDNPENAKNIWAKYKVANLRISPSEKLEVEISINNDLLSLR